MKTFKIKAKKFTDGSIVNEWSQYIIEEVKKVFIIWEDPFGDFDSGEPPMFSDINPETPCKSLDEVKKILLDNGLIEESSVFVDVEE
jgi:hypothetical protein